MELTQLQKEQILLTFVTALTTSCDDESQLKYLTKGQCINVILRSHTIVEQTTEKEREASIQSLIHQLYNDVMNNE